MAEFDDFVVEAQEGILDFCCLLGHPGTGSGLQDCDHLLVLLSCVEGDEFFFFLFWYVLLGVVVCFSFFAA